MSEKPKPTKPMLVDLKENVLVSTMIPKEYHAALRSGFVGYPPNPRWNISKFKAWKTGCAWKEALAKGTMVIRSTDSMLVPATEIQIQPPPPKPIPEKHKLSLPFWLKKQPATS